MPFHCIPNLFSRCLAAKHFKHLDLWTFAGFQTFALLYLLWHTAGLLVQLLCVSCQDVRNSGCSSPILMIVVMFSSQCLIYRTLKSKYVKVTYSCHCKLWFRLTVKKGYFLSKHSPSSKNPSSSPREPKMIWNASALFFFIKIRS